MGLEKGNGVARRGQSQAGLHPQRVGFTREASASEQSWQGADVNKAKISILPGRVEIYQTVLSVGPTPSLGLGVLHFMAGSLSQGF